MKPILALLLVMTGLSAHSSVLGTNGFIEPYAGYRSENIKLTDMTSTITELKASNPSLGLKIGYRSFIGVDLNLVGELSRGSVSFSNQPGKSNYSHKSAGVQLGVNALGLVKMYLGSMFLNDFTVDDSASLPGFTLSGPSYHAGVQFKFFPFISLGLQYSLNQFNTIKGTAYAAGDKLETYYSKNDTQDYSIYLSTSF